MMMLLVLGACQKTEIDSEYSAIAGEWIWAESTGGIAGTTIKPSTAREKVLEFTADGQFEITETDSLVSSGTYEIKMMKSIRSEEKLPTIVYSTEGFQQTFEIKNNELILFDEVYDGYTHRYVKPD